LRTEKGILLPRRFTLRARMSLGTALIVSALGVAALRPRPAHAGGDATAAACPNESAAGFRPYLPDCRAYEMVSPPYKDGFPILEPLAPGFSEATFAGGAPLVGGSSLGAFAGGPDTEAIGNDYLFRRGSESWETTPLDPPPSEAVVNFFPAPSSEQGVLAVNPRGESLLALHGPTESEYRADLYRRTLDGTLTAVGPMLPPAAIPPGPTGVRSQEEGLHFVAASEDIGHALFYIRPLRPAELPSGITSNVWPGDGTVTKTENGEGTLPFSLYEYTGTGHTGEGADGPRLVGVNDASELVSYCGTGLGGPAHRGNTHNAVAAGGAIIYFTASPECPGAKNAVGKSPPAYEILARVQGARTDAISEPSPSECGASASCAAAAPADANFEGASSDGTRVFFTTTQQLLPEAANDVGTHEERGEQRTDSAVRHGGCTAALAEGGCNLYEYDTTGPEGHRLTLVSAGAPSGGRVEGVAGVAEDGSRVYFAARARLAGANSQHIEPTAGGDNLYVFVQNAQTSAEGHPEGAVKFIATLSPGDAAQWSTNAEAPMNVTAPDGRYLVFTSAADLTADDTSSTQQVFRYDAESAELVRASIGNEGFNGDGNTEVNFSEIKRAAFVNGQPGVGANTHPSVSDDGEVVVFLSSDSLVPGAFNDPTNSAFNVYEYRQGHVYLISDGETELGSSQVFFGSQLKGVSASGQDIFFRTFAPLVPEDTDSVADVYDARVAGGFPAPAASSRCSGDGCQVPSGLPPVLGIPGSIGQPAGENAVPTAPAPKTSGPPKRKTGCRRPVPKHAAAKKTKRHRNSGCQKKKKKARHGPPRAIGKRRPA
jgi:hypothetical protein